MLGRSEPVGDLHSRPTVLAAAHPDSLYEELRQLAAGLEGFLCVLFDPREVLPQGEKPGLGSVRHLCIRFLAGEARLGGGDQLPYVVHLVLEVGQVDLEHQVVDEPLRVELDEAPLLALFGRQALREGRVALFEVLSPPIFPGELHSHSLEDLTGVLQEAPDIRLDELFEPSGQRALQSSQPPKSFSRQPGQSATPPC